MRSPTEDIRLVLASGSETRARMLANAGIAFLQDAADLDEAAIKRDCRSRGDSAEEAAVVLAESKARAIAPRHPRALVVGADQLLVSGDDWLDKPSGREAARTTLQKLRGRHHLLVSGMVVVRDEAVLCRHVEVAALAMRDYSDRFIQWYVDWAQDADLQVVGACRLEGPGAQAFARIDGDYFTILGLPLLPLMALLRKEGVLVD
ncbi:MAG: Maf family protein [Rhodospirillales bacterium]